MTKQDFEKYWTPEPFSGCWLWAGWTNTCGYGQIHSHRKLLAHRISWEIYRGEIPAGFQVLHHCDTPRCVNPDHLFIGTHADNHRDKALKGRGKTKLTLAQVEEVKTSRESIKELAQRFNVYPSTIGDIKRGVTWKPL